MNIKKWALGILIVILLLWGILFIPLMARAQEAAPVPKITPEQMQQCEEALNAAQHGNRPIVLPAGTPGKYVILEDHLMLEISMIDMKNDIMVLSEQISLCGVILQWEDTNGDGLADRKIMWIPVFMTDMGDWYFLPSHPAAGMLHPDDEWMKEEDIPEPPKIKPLPAPKKKQKYSPGDTADRA